MRLRRLPEFAIWLEDQTPKEQLQIEERLKRIRDHAYFGDSRDLGNGLAELKWKNGRRVYFSMTRDAEGQIVILILGGNKNGQSKDIRAARRLLAEYQK